MKIIGTGLSGLVGSRVVEIMSPRYEFINLSLDTGVDITNFQAVDSIISQSDADWVFHFAAFTNVDEAEKDRVNDKYGFVWRLNVEATDNLVQICQKTNKRLLYISTDFVFDGQKDNYDESDIPNPLNWYGITKFAGEKCVHKLGEKGLVIRIAYPYRKPWAGKPDFVSTIQKRLEKGEFVYSPIDMVFTPTYIDDIGNVIQKLMTEKADGIFHANGSSAISSYESAVLIADLYKYPVDLIEKTTFTEYFSGRAPRALRSILSNAKINKYGAEMKSFSEGIKLLKDH